MNVLVLGGGGREHALAWALARSPKLGKLYALPGSDAIAELAACLPGRAADGAAVAAACREHAVDLVVVGPEDPLAAGIADVLRAAGVAVFGPGEAAARLEASKSFCKDFLNRHAVPTARALTVTSPAEAERALDSFPDGRLVVKADGLAAGKGVAVCSSRAEARAALKECLEDKRFGDAGDAVVLEERLEGPEVSFMGLCDGKRFLALPASSDHKRLGDGDSGPNTGGMGVIAPTPHLRAADRERVEREIIAPTLRGLAADGLDFRGLLYCGLMMTRDGPKVLEFNVRFGDPETQTVLPLCRVDWLDLLAAAAGGDLSGKSLPADGAAVCVVQASAGYPRAAEQDREISGLPLPEDEALVFHAGTRKDGALWRTAGGRVLGLVGRGADLRTARERAYAAAKKVNFPGMQMRGDIGATGAALAEKA